MSQQATEQTRVLLIEDNPDDQLVIQRHLRGAYGGAAELTIVSQFAEAAEALGEQFDVCLLDYELGAYNALELLGQTRTDALSGPIILLTGHEDAGVDQAALELGVADFLSKAALSERVLERTIRYCRRQFADQRQLKFLAEHDQLTGLLNRHTFLQRLHDWLGSTTHSADSIYMLYVDLDGFKAINDSWGHDIGDQALKHAAQCLQGAVRRSDLVGRYGGDELIAAVAHVGTDGITPVVEKVMASLRQPLQVAQSKIVVTASIGVARASQSAQAADELVRLADHAMFAAKQAGRDTWKRYSSEVPLSAADRGQLESDLRTALGSESLQLTYESHVDLGTGQLVGAEALSRWQHPTRGAVSPAEFIPLVDANGLMRPFTDWVIDEALRTLAQWSAAKILPEGFRLSINVPAAILLDPDFPEHMARRLHQAELPGETVRLELTEHALLSEHGNTLVRLNALRKLGISLALDDFGTGHSSLAQIARLPIDTLKIDISFVAAMVSDVRAAALVRAIISLGHELGLTVIGEGVENAERARALQAMGCEVGQGYLFPSGGQDAFAAHLTQGPVAIGA